MCWVSAAVGRPPARCGATNAKQSDTQAPATMVASRSRATRCVWCGPVLDRFTCLQCRTVPVRVLNGKKTLFASALRRSAVLTKFIAHLFCILHIHSNTLINMSLQKPKISSLLCLVSFACTALPPWSALVFAAECLSDRALVSCRKRTTFTRCHFCS